MATNFFDRKRSVACAFSMVVLLSVALGNTFPNSSVKTTPGSSVKTTPGSPVKTTSQSLVEHVEQPVEKPIAVSENLAGDCNPLIINNCRVSIGTYGFDDTAAWLCGYVRTSGGTSEVILDRNNIAGNRGLILFELDTTTCKMTSIQLFDTWGFADDRIRLVEALDSASAGTILVGVSADSAETLKYNFRSSANWFFIKYNMNLSEVDLRYRDKFAFIIQKGYPKKTKYRRRPRYGNCLETSFTLRGTRVTDVTFSLG